MAHRTDPNLVDPDVIILSSDDEDDVNSGPAHIANCRQVWDIDGGNARFRAPSTAQSRVLEHGRSSANRSRLAPRQMPNAAPDSSESTHRYYEDEVYNAPAPIANHRQVWDHDGGHARFRSPSTSSSRAMGQGRSSSSRSRLTPRQMPNAAPASSINRYYEDDVNSGPAPIANSRQYRDGQGRDRFRSPSTSSSRAMERRCYEDRPRQMPDPAPASSASMNLYYEDEVKYAPAPIINRNQFRDNGQGHSRSRSPSTVPSGSLGHGRSSANRTRPVPRSAPCSAPRQMLDAALDRSESSNLLLEEAYKVDLAYITAHRDALQERVDMQATEIENLKDELADAKRAKLESEKAKKVIVKELANQRNSRGKHLADCLVENRELRDRITEAELAKIRAELETEKMQKELNMYRDSIQDPSASKDSGSSDDDGLQDPGQL